MCQPHPWTHAKPSDVQAPTHPLPATPTNSSRGTNIRCNATPIPSSILHARASGSGVPQEHNRHKYTMDSTHPPPWDPPVQDLDVPMETLERYNVIQ